MSHVLSLNWRVPEAFFKPELFDLEGDGLHRMIFDVQKSIFSLGGALWDLQIPQDSLLGQLPNEMFDHLRKYVRLQSLLPSYHFPFSLYSLNPKVTYNELTKEMRKVVLSGGPSLFPGMPERIHNELKALAPHITLKVLYGPCSCLHTHLQISHPLIEGHCSSWTAAFCLEWRFHPHKEHEKWGLYLKGG